MPLPPEPSVLDQLWAEPPPGNPGHVAARTEEVRIREAIGALPPVTRLPLVPWPAGDRLDELLATADLVGIGELYHQLSPLARHPLLDRVVKELGEEGTTVWREERPDDPVGMVIRAHQLVRSAWEGRGQGGDGNEFAAMTFATNLEWAAELCEQAARGLPGDITPLVVAQRTAVGGRDAVLAAARGWQAIDELHHFGNVDLLGMLAPDVAGAPDDQLGLARHLHARAPQGHPAHLVVTDALAARYFHEVAHLGATPVEADHVFIDAIDLVRSAHAASVGSPAWRVGWLEGKARNGFAFCAFFGNDDRLAWSEIQATRGHVLDLPWRLKATEPVVAYQQARAWLVRHLRVG